MLSDLQLARDVYAGIYLDALPTGAFDKLILGPANDAFVGIKLTDDEAIVCFRGSVTTQDWFENFQGFAFPVMDDKLGPVHPGFREPLLAIKDEIDAYLKPFEQSRRVRVLGHSRGAGQALQYAAFRIVDDKPIQDVLTWGAPRPGCAKLAAILAPLPSRSKLNGDLGGHDYVTDVPFRIPPEFRYQHPKPLIRVSAPPLPTDKWLLLKYHHFSLYIQGEANPPPTIQFGRLTSEDIDK